MQVAIHPNEDLLNEVLRALPIADRSINEVQQPGLVALNQHLKGALLSTEELGHQRRVIQSV